MVGRTGQQRHGKAGMVTLDLGEQLCSVTGADVNVEQDDVDVAALELRASPVQQPRLVNSAALELEIDAAEQADGRVVVDDENGLAGRPHRAASLPRTRIRS